MAKNGTIGKCKLFPQLDEEVSVYVSLAVLRPKQNIILPKYLLYIIQSKIVQQQLLLRTKKHGGVGNLHLEEIREVEIPLPPLKTQREIVKKLDKQMEALEGVRLLKKEAQKRIAQILTEVWGE